MFLVYIALPCTFPARSKGTPRVEICSFLRVRGTAQFQAHAAGGVGVFLQSEPLAAEY